jgi:hypothetical protein
MREKLNQDILEMGRSRVFKQAYSASWSNLSFQRMKRTHGSTKKPELLGGIIAKVCYVTQFGDGVELLRI